jgi:TonB family protein
VSIILTSRVTLITTLLCFGVVHAVIPGTGFQRRQIPAAELPCTPEEAKWWEEVRAVGTTVQSSRGKKKREEFLELLKAGKANSYQPPLEDRKPTMLAFTPPEYSEAGRRDRLTGRVELQVELQANGTVGEVVVVRGIRSDLDQNAIEAARKAAFLPAVQKREFVTVWMPMEMSFHLY